MLTPSYLAACSDDLVRLLGELDESIMRDFVRRLVKAGHITDSAKWQAQQMMEAGALYDDIVAEAAKLTGRTENAVRELFREAGLKSVAYDINICRAAGLSPLPLSASPAATQVLLSGMEKTKGMLDNLTMTTANGAQRAFIEAATLAEMQVESGAFDYVTAIRNAVRTASSSGAWVLYPTGARSRLDTATRRAVLTGVNQTAASLTLAYADDMDCDLVETTAHMGARPEHAVWQVFSRSGKSRRYPDFVTATGYGTGPGLCGWNCRHSFYMFFEGIDERAYSRAQLDEYANAKVSVNGKEMPYYEATQRQRAMERRVRDTRRELAGLDGGIKAAPDEAVKNALQQDFDSAAARLKRHEAALKDFARQTGLALDTSRVQVQGFGRSTSAKAVWAAKPFAKFKRENLAVSKNQLLPNYTMAKIQSEKLTGYALNMNHPKGGRNKAIAFERALGYTVDNATELRENILAGLKKWRAWKRPTTSHGQPFEVKMLLTGPNGKQATVKTAWQIDTGDDVPRLISVYVYDDKGR